ncbi:RSP_2648 family PIN domain-containing protein [Candidatus Rhodobacter oscarellae]|uniref:RSP_2648 family PIN domain-containing protein n=1 Tax=Candidatus Rhodobacter oscarellae TaxID=1675527 RepID=UPI002285A248|nr:PIN domain-containing protein [Candidatus Rhodobacter lobularis]
MAPQRTALLDACVLYPTVMREVTLATARAGLFVPVWSERILEEWARAARKIGPDGELIARGEIALLRSSWPDAIVPDYGALEARLWLPDPNDRHVLASAIAGDAAAVITLNLRDFPRTTLAMESVEAIHPDEFLLGMYHQNPQTVSEAIEPVRQQAEALSGSAQPIRALLKKARLPRLGKALEKAVMS